MGRVAGHWLCWRCCLQITGNVMIDRIFKAFFSLKALYTEDVIHSPQVVVSYMCSHSCPEPEWLKCGSPSTRRHCRMALGKTQQTCMEQDCRSSENLSTSWCYICPGNVLAWSWRSNNCIIDYYCWLVANKLCYALMNNKILTKTVSVCFSNSNRLSTTPCIVKKNVIEFRSL